MKYLVTGAAGFIGTNFVYHMLEKHPSDLIVGIDNLSYAGNIKNLKQAQENSNFVLRQADITDQEAMTALFKEFRFDYVVNFAAQTHVDRSIVDPGIFVKTNVLGTQILLDLARETGVKRFHQIGTDEVYGDLPLEATDQFFVGDCWRRCQRRS